MDIVRRRQVASYFPEDSWGVSAEATAAKVRAFEEEVERHYRWNYVTNLLYGLFGTTGWRLITAPTFVPDYMYRLGGSNVAVGFLIFVGGLCRFASPPVGAAYIAHRPAVKKYAVTVGAIMRLQILLMALSGLLLSAHANLPAFFLFYSVFNLFNGIQSVIFSLMMAKVIPLERRGGFIGLRDFAGGVTAAVVALQAGRFLETMPFPQSYALTYLIAFAFTSVGLICFSFIREPLNPWTLPRLPFRHILGQLPQLLRRDPNFALYCLCRALGTLAMMSSPYFIIYAGSRLVLTGAQIGYLTFVFFLAQTATNLLWGRIADRRGFRTVFVLGGLAYMAAVLLLLGGAMSVRLIMLVFLLVGIGQGGFQMAAYNMVFEFGPLASLGMRIAVVNSVGEFMAAVAPFIGGFLADHVSYGSLFFISALFMTVAEYAMIQHVAEPRVSFPGK